MKFHLPAFNRHSKENQTARARRFLRSEMSPPPNRSALIPMTELASGTAGELNVPVKPFDVTPFHPEPTSPKDVPGVAILGFVVLFRTVNAPPAPTRVPLGEVPNDRVDSVAAVIEKMSPAADGVVDS